MNAPSAIAVVETRLPYIDRRALSQAWFSALHLTADRCAGARANSAPEQRREPQLSRARIAAHTARSAAMQAPARPASGRAAASRSAAAQRMETQTRGLKMRLRPPYARSYPPARAAFTIGVDGARVALLIRREGGTLHVVALCSARHVELVRRALAGAAAALGASGDTVRAAVRTTEATA